MLVSFSVGNFLSFRNIQTLNFSSEPLKEYTENLIIPYLYNSDERLLKSIAIYGHNSFGKSNFLKAYQFLHKFIFSSFSDGQKQDKIPVEPFKLNISMLGRPSFFEVTFLLGNTKYRYKVLMTSDHIIEEELHYAEAKIRENYLFERRGQEIKIGKTWNKEADGKPEQLVLFAKPNILYLSVLQSQDIIPRITTISKWLKGNLFLSDNYINELKVAKDVYSNLNYQSLILKFIESADLGFTTIFDKVRALAKSQNQLEEGLLNIWYSHERENFELYTKHTVFDQSYKEVGSIEFELLKNESAGSVKYFIIVSLLSYAIKNSQLIWIDELDARLDSILLQKLLRSFHSTKINPNNSQLVFTTHNTILIDENLRRDQMVVVEKDQNGESTIKRVHTAKTPIRSGKSLAKEYRKGSLGGVSKKIQGYSGPTLFD